MKKSAIVIGAGMGGIVAATHLAQHGLRVTVIEKNSRPGGRCDRISREGHHFDTGPTLMVMPLLYDAEFAALGADMHELVKLRRIDPTYHLVFDDGSQLSLTSNMDDMCEQLEAIEPGAFDAFRRYLDEGRRHYAVGPEKLVNRDFRTFGDFFNLDNLPLIYQLKPFARHYDHMAGYFDSSRLKAAFTFQDVYMGLSPFEAPATFSMMPYTEIAHGVWYPQGGMYAIVEAMMGLARDAGVEFIFDTEVTRIVIDDDRARGVVLEGGEEVCADVVLANADLPYVYRELLPPDGLGEKLSRKRYSCSTISFFWGVDCEVVMPPHTLFLAEDYRENFVSIIRDLDMPANPSVYVHAPARLDPTMAPPGEDTLIAVVPVGHLSETKEQNWGEIRDRAREHVFRRLALLGVDDLREHIKFETSFNPLSWRKRYNLVKGATHGLCHNLTQLAWFRPGNCHPDYENLYFVGASTHPGTGLPTAMVSGRLVARRITEEMGIYRIGRPAQSTSSRAISR
ncbi:MAG TPA: phytoene desaturase family protein [Promineifilum sp.]|nr:phytoene desaturase family protein [Promineifilum sp.]